MKMAITITGIRPEPCRADMQSARHLGAYRVVLNGDSLPGIQGATTACLDHLGYAVGALGQQVADTLQEQAA